MLRTVFYALALTIALAMAVHAQGVDPAKVKAYADSISAETCRGGTLSTSGLTCRGATAAARVTWLRRFANGLRALQAVTPPPPVPPVDTQPTPPPPQPPPTPGAPALPREFALAPPAASRTITVAAGQDLQAAINAAQRGDALVLQAGATWTGNFSFPAKAGSCANGWVTVRSSATASLRPRGVRVTMADSQYMPTIVTPNSAAATTVRAGSCGYAFTGVRWTVSTTYVKPAQQYHIVLLGETGTAQSTLAQVPSDILLDRVIIHGRDSTNTSRCVSLNAARAEITDSQLRQCHAKGQDAQAIGGFNGAGPYRIENDHLEGSGENIMFGGSDPSVPNLVPADIVIRRNYIATPVAWKAGNPWTRKNLLELKSAVRVLIEDNVLEGNWTDGQTGLAVLFRSANQSGGCRLCRTTDVTFRRNLIRNTAGGINFIGDGNVDTTLRRVLATDNVIEVGAHAGDQRGFQILKGARDITVQRTVIAVAPGGSMSATAMVEGGAPCTFRDNVWARGMYGVMASGSGTNATTALNMGCGAGSWSWSNITMVGAAFAGYPTGTSWVASESAAPLAATIRAVVQQATAGVVVPP